ncbi:MAG: quinoprotein dehydrogenase-associated SoxYZ-like carrier [Geminicoccaceae bacterium]
MNHQNKLISAVLLGTAMVAGPALGLDRPQTPLDDPYRSGMLDYMQVELLGDPEAITFDDRVVVMAPATAEDSFHVPVTVDATAIPNVEQITLFVDYGPIPHILDFYPEAVDARLSFRFKIDQATPVRAAVKTTDGQWYLGSTRIDAAGGGCTAPAAAYASDDWEEHLGEVRGRMWADTGRVRVIVDHPMDTGLADGIPVFIGEELALEDEAGTRLARVDLSEPVNEDPAFTFHLAENHPAGPLRISGRDNNGNEIDATIPVGNLTQ